MTQPQDPFAVPDRGESTIPAYDRQSSAGSYGQPIQPAGARAHRNGIGTASIVVGILALLTSITVVGGVLLGVVAIILGVVGRSRVKRGEATNGGSTTAGLILGAVALVLSLALVALGASFLNSSSGKQLQNCLSNAGNNQAAQVACQRQFQSKFTK